MIHVKQIELSQLCLLFMVDVTLETRFVEYYG